MTIEHPFLTKDWLPESDPDSGFAQWNDLQTVPYNEHEHRETAAQPLVVSWSQFAWRVIQQKAIRDSLREQGFCFLPWVIAEYFKVGWHDFSQGNRGSCAGCATNHAVNAMLLTHMADGYRIRYKRFNPYLTWELGKKDAGIRGEGASLSSMLTCANKRGMFDVTTVGTYEESLRNPPQYTNELLADRLVSSYDHILCQDITFECYLFSIRCFYGLPENHDKTSALSLFNDWI